MKRIAYILSLVMIMSFSFLDMSAKDAKESVTAEFTVSPKMSCQNCENKIKSNLRFEKGITNIVTSLKDQKVTVTYNPAKTNKEKIVKAFQKIGYTATEYTKDAKTTVCPENCGEACASKVPDKKKSCCK